MSESSIRWVCVQDASVLRFLRGQFGLGRGSRRSDRVLGLTVRYLTTRSHRPPEANHRNTAPKTAHSQRSISLAR